MGQIYGKIQDTAREKLIPFDTMFEVTYGCNQECIHCYNTRRGGRHMSLDEIVRVLEQLAAAGGFMLTLTGGEALTRPDFFDIAAEARHLGFSLSLISNGILISEGIADRLVEVGFTDIGVSLFSVKPEIHESITRTPGSCEKAKRGIDLLVERGQKVTLRTVIIKNNAGDCEDLIRFAEERGMRYLVDPSVSPKHDGNTEPLKYQLEPEQLPPFYADERINFSLSGFPRESCSLPDCDAGRSVCAIDPLGNLYPCLQLPIKLGNLLEEPFDKLWRETEEIKEWRRVRLEHLEECSGCEHGPYCLRCSGVAYLEGHGVVGKSDSACTVARVIHEIVSKKKD